MHKPTIVGMPEAYTAPSVNVDRERCAPDIMRDQASKSSENYSEKINNSFPEEYSHPHRKGRCLGGGGLLMYVNADIPSRLLKLHEIST